MDRRPDTPSEIKRILRAESRFGCCRCGFPILEYHHIVPWAEDKHFRPEDMMVLCPTCHDMASKGALSIEKQRAFKKRPHNVKKGFASGLLSVDHSFPAFVLGTNVVVSEGPILTIIDAVVFSASIVDGEGLVISLTLNGRDGRSLAVIVNNEWIGGDNGTWDLESSYQWLKIRERKNKICFEIDTKAWPISLHGTLWHNGRRVAISPASLSFGGRHILFIFKNMTFVGHGFRLTGADDGTDNIGISLDLTSGFSNAMMMPGIDRDTIARALTKFSELRTRIRPADK